MDRSIQQVLLLRISLHQRIHVYTTDRTETDLVRFSEKCCAIWRCCKGLGDSSRGTCFGFRLPVYRCWIYIDDRLCGYFKRWLANYKVDPANLKTTPPQIREKCAMMACVIDLFCPSRGIVCNLFAGIMTLLLAAVRWGRCGVFFERGISCFNLALAHLCRIFSSIDNSKRSGKGTISMKLREIVSHFHDWDTYINDDIETR